MSAVVNMLFIAPNNAKIMIKLIISIDVQTKPSLMKNKKSSSWMKIPAMGSQV